MSGIRWYGSLYRFLFTENAILCWLHAYAGYLRENTVIISIVSAIRGGGSTGWVVYAIRSQVKQVPSYFTFITQLYVVQAMVEHYCCADKVKG